LPRNEARAALKKQAEDRQALQQQPAGSLVLLASLLHEVGEPERGTAVLHAAWKRFPGDYRVNYELGMSSLVGIRMERPEEAIRFLTGAIAARPRSAVLHVRYGAVLFNAKDDPEGAIAAFRLAIDLDPNLPLARTNLGTVLFAQGQLKEANDCFRRAIEIDPKSIPTYLKFSEILASQGRHDEAIAVCRKAISHDPLDGSPHAALAAVLYKHGKVQEAIAAYRQAIALAPKLAVAHANLGTILSTQGEVVKATACFRKAIEIDPTFPNVYYNLGTVLSRQRMNDEAIVCFRRAIELAPRDPEPHANLGLVLANQGKVDEALSHLHQATALGPRDAHAHSSLAFVLLGQGRLDEAIVYYKKTIALAPNDVQAHFNLGTILSRQNKNKEAETAYRQVIKLDPDHAKAHCHLGYVLRGQGRMAESLLSFERGHALGLKLPDWNFPSRTWVRIAQRMADLEEKLPSFLKGDRQPKNYEEALELATICGRKRWYAGSARFYASALAALPADRKKPISLDRFKAACAAVQAGCGHDEGPTRPDDHQSARLRKQALTWLRADLAGWGQFAETGRAKERAMTRQAMQILRSDDALAGVRDKGRLARLPQDEREQWRMFWADVSALLHRCTAGP
jgi:tetratricopeptide (TPR) repeat protein